MEHTIATDDAHQRLDVHCELTEAEDHQTEVATCHRLDRNPRPHMERRYWHLGVSTGLIPALSGRCRRSHQPMGAHHVFLILMRDVRGDLKARLGLVEKVGDAETDRDITGPLKGGGPRQRHQRVAGADRRLRRSRRPPSRSSRS